MKHANVTLQAPWLTYVAEVEELFKGDPDVTVEYDDRTKSLTLKVEGPKKADALTQLLPTRKDYGNISLYITVVPADSKEMTNLQLLKTALEGNPLFKETIGSDVVTPTPISFCVMAKEIVQFYNDDCSDAYGNKTCLAADVARDVFDTDSVFFCTDNK